MSELRSKCCGADVELFEEEIVRDGYAVIKIPYYECSKCYKPTEVEGKSGKKKGDRGS